MSWIVVAIEFMQAFIDDGTFLFKNPCCIAVDSSDLLCD